MPLRPTHAVVDLDALGRNWRHLTGRLPEGVGVLPVVKADAYGHGARPVARRLVEEGAGMLAVAVVEEGMELRGAAIGTPILVMGWIGPTQLDALVIHGLTPNAHSPEQLKELIDFAEAKDVTLPVHLKLDTGMTRLGILPGQLSDALQLLRKPTGRVFLEGVFQNYASADEASTAQTAEQTKTFASMLAAIRGAGHLPTMIHADNSAAMLSSSSSSEKNLLGVSHVRPGLALYARVPGLPFSESIADVMSFVSVVDQVKRVPAGTRIGYGGTFVCRRETTVAVVPAGYADGVPRSLSGQGQVLVRGRRCPIAGRISMDLTAVDATDLPEPPRRGDPVAFFGAQGGARLGVEEVAEAAGTVPWEILCGVGPRVPRIILRGGIPVETHSKFL
ncbi:MAG TPA: alanine racemase [Thermoanaerobaculia bacterium]|nr:alanine racemase [Thermoanaerobaculia bacterium]